MPDPTGDRNQTGSHSPLPGTNEPTGATLPPDAALSSAGVPARIGRYEVRQVLGEGAFGRVYRGFDPELRRDVAIKVPHPHGLTPAFRERFLREARAAATIHHANVCPIHDVGTDGELPFIVMHFVPSGTLAKLLEQRQSPFPAGHAVAIARKLAQGVAAAHDKGIIHRDLKPQNVLWDDASREVLVTDFGLARIGGEAQLSRTGDVMGTPAYMAPEQARGKQSEVGPLADVYSLGVILYRLMTNELPFQGSAIEVLAQAQFAEPKPPSTLQGELDARLDAICLRAMAKKPEDRFPSARAFADALADFLRAEAKSGVKEPDEASTARTAATPGETRSTHSQRPDRAKRVQAQPVPSAQPAPPARRLYRSALSGAVGLILGLAIGGLVVRSKYESGSARRVDRLESELKAAEAQAGYTDRMWRNTLNELSAVRKDGQRRTDDYLAASQRAEEWEQRHSDMRLRLEKEQKRSADLQMKLDAYTKAPSPALKWKTPVVVTPRPLTAAELAKADAPILLFDSKLKGARIELPGLDPRFRAEPKEGGPKVTVKDAGGQTVATLEVDKNGVVTLGGRGLAANPMLGLAVVKVTAGGQSQYRQLFKETEVQGAALKADGDKGVFTLDPGRLLKEQHPRNPVLEEYEFLAGQDGALALDRREPPKLRVGGKDLVLDLELSRLFDPLTRVKGETPDFTATATLEKGKLVIEVTRKVGGAPPQELTVQSLKIIRPVKDGDTMLLQEFVRVKVPGLSFK